ncbi:MAG: hypothetical protein K5931_07495 [Lachnospiraceae bacterium]|nr:hypothetical protein [Lachnospiraceae bacterium]
MKKSVLRWLCLGLTAVLLNGCTQGLYTMESMTDQKGEEALNDISLVKSDEPIVEDGMMQPILAYSDLRDPQYSNEESDILRYCVYVETDNDTDNDGKADLVKVFSR